MEAHPRSKRKIGHHPEKVRTHPSTSVLDLNCRMHQQDERYVADASFFPSIEPVNPTLTGIAGASRAADHLRGLGA